MEPATAARFAIAARTLADAARSLGLVAPGFRSPPRLVGTERSLRRCGGRSTVSVRVRGRSWLPVLADMVEGVLVANALTGPAAARARDELWVAVSAEVEEGALGDLADVGRVA
jgi:hypothetical protein